ncbi:MAG: hypothetical protein R6V04_03460 [bacterium]
MKKFFITFIILLILVSGIYFVSGMIFDAAARAIITQLKPQLKNQGITLDDYDYKCIRFSSLRTITVYDFYSLVKLQKNNKFFTSYFYAEKIHFRLLRLKKTAITISCSDFNTYVKQLKDIPGTSFARIDQGFIELGQPILLSQPLAGFKKGFQNITNLFDERKTSFDIILRARVTINLNEKKSQVYLHTVQEEGQILLRFNKEDIKKMANIFAVELSDEEAAIIARYPLRATRIMQITLDAKDSSRKAKRKNRSVPEDAYRHVLWSYLLTREFGPEFAQKVTDAHETLPTNTAAQRAMDFHNNRIGRDYALQGISRDRILWLVRNDKKVIKNPREVLK